MKIYSFNLSNGGHSVLLSEIVYISGLRNKSFKIILKSGTIIQIECDDKNSAEFERKTLLSVWLKINE